MRAIVLRQQGHSNGSGAALARALGIRSSGPETQRRARFDRYVINYGVSAPINWTQRRLTMSNSNTAIANAVDKRETLQLLGNANIPTLAFTNETTRAKGWLDEDGKIVIRNTVTGHSGAGIVIHREGNIPRAPLYTRYFKKDVEYRVHIAFGNCILLQQKRRANDSDRTDRDNGLIRTNANGWVFSINGLDCDTRNYRASLVTLATSAIQALGLAHGAVDILVKHKRIGAPSMVVCEVNSAPALRNPSTLAAYVSAFQGELRRLGCDGFN